MKWGRFASQKKTLLISILLASVIALMVSIIELPTLNVSFFDSNKSVDPAELVYEAQKDSGVPVPGGGVEAESFYEYFELAFDEIVDARRMAVDAPGDIARFTKKELTIFFMLCVIGSIYGKLIINRKGGVLQGILGFVIIGETIRITFYILTGIAAGFFITIIVAMIYFLLQLFRL